MIAIRPNRCVSVTTLALLTVLGAGARSARAAEPTMSECLSANESSIKRRGDHKLRQARDQSLVCAASTCPEEVRDACQLRVKNLIAAMPTIVFLAKDGAGRDVVAVRVSMDGEPIGDRLDGSAIPIDPGLHTFAFAVAGQRPVERSLVISEGQKDRRETVTLGAPAAGATAAPIPAPAPTTPSVSAPSPVPSAVAQVEPAPAGSPGGRQRVIGIVVGAAGVVGLGLGAVSGGIAASEWSSAKAACDGKPVSCTTNTTSPGFKDEGSATKMAAISTVGFIAGGVLAAAGVVVFLTAPRGSSGDAPASVPAMELTPSASPRGPGIVMRGWF